MQEDKGAEHQVFYPTPRSLEARVEMFEKAGLVSHAPPCLCPLLCFHPGRYSMLRGADAPRGGGVGLWGRGQGVGGLGKGGGGGRGWSGGWTDWLA